MNDFKKYSILIVDDEELLLETIVFDFIRKGFTVFSANNAESAFELVKKNKIHLVISDIRMPGKDGLSLLDSIREYDPRMPVVILITGFADVTTEECINRGAFDVIAKPFNRKALMQSVLSALGEIEKH